MVGVHGVKAGRLLAASVMLCVGLVALSVPAGAAGRDHALRRTFTARSGAVGQTGVPESRVGSAGAHGISPLTEFTGTTYVTDENTGDTTDDITPRLTDLTALGNSFIDGTSLTAAIEGWFPGDSGPPAMTMGIVTPGNAPLKAGTVYSTDSGSTFSVDYPVRPNAFEGCSPGLDPNSAARWKSTRSPTRVVYPR